jgi:sn-glycerol 3-phosphate transport system substrate-binding protein
MSGTNGNAVQALVNKYNSSQKKVYVQAVFTGSYDDNINKLRQALPTHTTPDMIQMYDIGTRFMVDSGDTTTMQSYVDKDKFDMSQFEKNVTAFYTVDGKLQSMPWNSSNPILYYNKDMFRAAGLDPEKPPQTWEDVAADAKAITQHFGGDVKGFTMPIDDWYFEQTLATQGALFANPDNGRNGKAATQAAYNSPQGVAWLTWWSGMIKDGIAANLGRNSSDTKAAFIAGKVAMDIDSTAGLRQLIDQSAGKFTVGTGYYPRPANNSNAAGTIIGGASLWIMKDHPQAEQDAAWDFIKFLMQPENLAFWHVNTGYYPPSKAAYDVQMDKDWLAKYPQFSTAINQLHDAPLNTATTGALMGVYVQVRQINQSAFESVFAGQATPQQALDNAAKQATDAITQYNQSLGH